MSSHEQYTVKPANAINYDLLCYIFSASSCLLILRISTMTYELYSKLSFSDFRVCGTRSCMHNKVELLELK